MNKYLISADIEGITGVINKNFASENGSHYKLACRYMVSDINAVVQGILNQDSKAHIVVRDAHGTKAANLDLEALHPKAQLIQGWPAIQNMLTGLEPDFKGVFCVGYHAGGENVAAVLSHTLHSLISHIKVNGKHLNELGIAALYAGYYDIPIAFISGDDQAIIEAKEQLGNIVGIEVKKSFDRTCTLSLSLEQSRRLLTEGAAYAVMQLEQKKFQPLRFKKPLTLEVKFYDSGYRVSVFHKLFKILQFDPAYQFIVKDHTLTFSDNNILELLSRLNLVLHVVYGISSSG